MVTGTVQKSNKDGNRDSSVTVTRTVTGTVQKSNKDGNRDSSVTRTVTGTVQ